MSGMFVNGIRKKSFSELTKWERRWFNAAVENAQMSKDPSTKVGAVIISPCGRRRVSEGYNGLPQKVADFKWRLDDRTYKYPATIHAELNAILFSKQDLTNHMLFTTQPPCSSCAPVIIQSGITRVGWISPSKDYWERWATSCMFGRALMGEANIEMLEYML